MAQFPLKAKTSKTSMENRRDKTQQSLRLDAQSSIRIGIGIGIVKRAPFFQIIPWPFDGVLCSSSRCLVFHMCRNERIASLLAFFYCIYETMKKKTQRKPILSFCFQANYLPI